MSDPRLTPDRLSAVDELLTAAAQGFDVLADGFPYLLESHELTAAHQAVFDQLDSQFTPAQVAWMLTVAIGRASLRRTQPEAKAFPKVRGFRDPAAIHGRNAVEDPIQDAHGALWDSMTGPQRTDAQRILDGLADKGDEAVSGG